MAMFGALFGGGGGGGGGGDVNGPGAPVVDDNIVTWNGTSGEDIQDSGVGIASLVTASSSNTFTNKTFDADGTGNSITNIENADIKAAAAIAVNKLAAVTASRAVVSDGSGFISAATTTATEIGYVNGVTSAIQTQLNNKGTKTYAMFTPLDNQPPAANYATISTRNSIAILAFDDSTGESAIFNGICPENAQLSSGLIVRIHWVAASATTGDCVWEVSFMAMNSTTDIDADSFDTAASGTTTTAGTAGFTNVTAITITTIDSLAAGQAYRLKVARTPGAGGDDMVGDAQVHSVEVRSAA